MSYVSDIWKAATDKQVTLEKLKSEAATNELSSAIAERNARVAQELAIADRIGTAAEVTIEEFYEYKDGLDMEGHLDSTKADIKFSGNGQRVAKRIYTFKGIVGKTTTDAEGG